jgi:hypothetical protein
MAYNTSCKNGHSFIAADIYEDWPDDAPHCPICYEKWCEENDFEISSYMKKCADGQREYGLYGSMPES